MKKIILLLFTTISIFASIGNIMALKGEVTIKHANAEKRAKSGMKVIQGDTIVTADKSRVQVVLKDDTMVTIGSNSSFQFDQYFFDGSKKSMVKMKANRGFFRSVTGKIGKIAPERFTVETSSATIGIRGTDFSVKIKGKRERFKCHRGRISIRIGSQLIELGAGQMFELNPHILDQILRGHLRHQKFDLQDMVEFDRNGELEELLIPEKPDPISDDPDPIPYDPGT